MPVHSNRVRLLRNRIGSPGMSLVFDKHRLISGLTLPPTSLRQPRAIAHRHNADTVLTIGLFNNMPDSALQATERQFKGLLKAAAGSRIVDLRYFSLPSVKRSWSARSRIKRFYTNVADLDRLRLDGLIVTGAEPNAPFLAEEPYWQEFTKLVDWANANTRSTIWSCLAAHAAVLNLDGIERHRLSEKCSGVFDCARVADDWLIRDIPLPLKVSHSRLNELKGSDLAARGYRLLTQSREAGVDIFVKKLRSHFIFFQGHPEYDAMSLQREYRRDIIRFLAGESDTFPATPSGYFDAETEHRLANFQKRARIERKPAVIAELPHLTLRPDIAAGTASKVIFRNWLEYLADHSTNCL
jgi:homoserine O-succinyltransferase/O-acetyltransferase